jgi:hypothetical protein
MDVDANHKRREKLTRHLCAIMGWEYKTGPVYAGLRKAALAEAVVVGLDKLEEIITRLSPPAAADLGTETRGARRWRG